MSDEENLNIDNGELKPMDIDEPSLSPPSSPSNEDVEERECECVCEECGGPINDEEEAKEFNLSDLGIVGPITIGSVGITMERHLFDIASSCKVYLSEQLRILRKKIEKVAFGETVDGMTVEDIPQALEYLTHRIEEIQSDIEHLKTIIDSEHLTPQCINHLNRIYPSIYIECVERGTTTQDEDDDSDNSDVENDDILEDLNRLEDLVDIMERASGNNNSNATSSTPTTSTSTSTSTTHSRRNNLQRMVQEMISENNEENENSPPPPPQSQSQPPSSSSSSRLYPSPFSGIFGTGGLMSFSDGRRTSTRRIGSDEMNSFFGMGGNGGGGGSLDNFISRIIGGSLRGNTYEDVKVPLKVSVVSEMPIVKYDSSDDKFPDEMCPVSFDDFVDGEDLIYTSLCCKRYIKRKCAYEWWDKQHTCPVCGKNFHNDASDNSSGNTSGESNTNANDNSSNLPPLEDNID